MAILHGGKLLEGNVVPSARPVKVSSPTRLFSLLSHRRVEYIIYELWAAERYMRDLGLPKTNFVLSPLAIHKMYIYLNKRHRDLIPRLSGSLRAMKTDGSDQSMVLRYLTYPAQDFGRDRWKMNASR